MILERDLMIARTRAAQMRVGSPSWAAAIESVEDLDGATSAGSEPDPWNLTEREREVLGLLAIGLTNREIGERLFVTEKTASVHVSDILGKLGVPGRGAAAAMAVRMCIVAVRRATSVAGNHRAPSR